MRNNSPFGLLVPFLIMFAIMGAITAYTQLVYLPSPWNLTVSIDNGRMQPAEIVISKGAKVFVTVFSKDSDHHLSIQDFSISVNIARGEKTVIEFFAEKVGIYPVRLGSRLVGTIAVVEPGFGSVEHAHG